MTGPVTQACCSLQVRLPAGYAAKSPIEQGHCSIHFPTHPNRTSPPIPCRTNPKAWLLLIALTTCSC